MDLQPMPSLADQHRKIATPTLANRISELTSPNQQHNFIPTNGYSSLFYLDSSNWVYFFVLSF
uniref:Uncharacterized protein n=1 Tax=Solanum lycopersicum TaxID=4081 RepID=A0A3Q7J8E1_SOLLC